MNWKKKRNGPRRFKDSYLQWKSDIETAACGLEDQWHETYEVFLCRKANTRLAGCIEPQDEEVMIVAAKEKKHHCRSVTKLITNNGAMQAQTDIMYVSENGIERGSDEESIHMAVAQRQCSGDVSFLAGSLACLA